MMKKAIGKKGSLPYSAGIKVGNLVFISGHIGMDENGNLVPGGVEAETEQIIKNIETVLRDAGGTLDDIVKTTVYLCDIGDFPKMNKIYAKYFQTKVLPTRATVGVKDLILGASVEMEAIAVID